jgi:hypothetical protein
MTADEIMSLDGEWTLQRVADVRAALSTEAWPLFFDLTSVAILGDSSPCAIAAMAKADEFTAKRASIEEQLDTIEKGLTP